MVSISLDIPKLFVNLPVEMCGHYFNEHVHSAEPKLFLDNIGVNLETRGACVSRTDHPITWHTHPKGRIWYPSPEDIIRTFQTKSPSPDYIHSSSTSLIFTEKGIWELFALKTFNLDPTWNKYFLDILNNVTNDFGLGRLSLQRFIQETVRIVNDPKLGNFFRLYWTEWSGSRYSLQGAREMDTVAYLVARPVYELYFVDRKDIATREKLRNHEFRMD